MSITFQFFLYPSQFLSIHFKIQHCQTWQYGQAIMIIKLRGFKQKKIHHHWIKSEHRVGGKKRAKCAGICYSHSYNNTHIWRILCWKDIAMVRRKTLLWNILSQNVMWCSFCLSCFLDTLITSQSFTLLIVLHTFLTHLSTSNFFPLGLSTIFIFTKSSVKIKLLVTLHMPIQ